MSTFAEVQRLVELVVLAVVVLQQTTSCTGAEWSYDDHHGTTGPSYWKNAYPFCAGSSQSPINVVLKDAKYKPDMAPVVFEGYDTIPENVSYTLVNNGHTVQLNVKNAALNISGGGLPGSYRLTQFHLHWGKQSKVGSEHRINGNFYPMEIHFVHFSNHFPDIGSALGNSTGLAVIGVFVDIGDKNDAFDDIIAQLHSIKFKGTNTTNIRPFKMATLLPAKSCDFIRYPGSLTTPPCHESVIWTILQYTIKISEAQLNAFRALSHGAAHDRDDVPLADNYRPVQRIGTRKVLRTFAIESPASGTIVAHRFHGVAAAAAAMSLLMMRLLC